MGGSADFIFMGARIFLTDCLLTSIKVESTPYFLLLGSISVLGEREEGAGWWGWVHSPGRDEVGGGCRGLAT